MTATESLVPITDEMAELMQPDNENIWNIVVAATNKDGFYKSIAGHRCYPVILNEERGKVFIIDIDAKYIEYASLLKWKTSDYAFKIGKFLPVDYSGTGAGRKEDLYRTVKGSGFAVVEKNGKMFAHQMDSSSFGGGYSDGLKDALGEIFSGNGHPISAIPENAEKMVGDAFVDIKRRPIGKDEGCVILYGRRNGKGFLRYECSDDSIKKAVPGKKSPLFKTIDMSRNSVTVLSKVAFTTESGLTICNPVRILDQW